MDAANDTETDFLPALMAMWAAGAAVDNVETVAAVEAPAPVAPAAPVVERFASGTVRVTMNGLEYERGPKVRGRIVRWFAYTSTGRARRVTNSDTLATLTALDG
jgi:hypothetical protein